MKQNYFDGVGVIEDLNDISNLSTDGTPCIFISGDNDKVGIIT